MSKSTYKYNEDYQKRIVALICKDPDFLKSYFDVVNPSYFDFPHLTTLTRHVIEIFEKHGQLPSRDVVIEKIKQYCVTFNLGQDVAEVFFAHIKEIYDIDIFDIEVVKDDVIKFGKYQAMRHGVTQIAGFIDDIDEYDKAKVIIEDALKVGTNTLDMGLNFFDSLQNYENILNDTLAVGTRIPTQIPILDRVTFGGPAKKELWVIMGLSKGGKSQWLLNMCVNALEYGLNVVYITIGDLTEEDIFIRSLSRMTFIPVDDLVKPTSETIA